MGLRNYGILNALCQKYMKLYYRFLIDFDEREICCR